MTELNQQHDLALEFESVQSLLRKYRDRDPDKTAIVDLDQGASITFGGLYDEAHRIANYLRERGFRKGARIAVPMNASKS